MKKQHMNILIWVLALLPVVAVAACYGALPEQVPTHWNMDGTVTYSGKAILWLLALLSPALGAALRAMPKIDPKRSNYARFQQYYDGFCIVLMLFLAVLNAVTLVESLRPGTISVWRTIILAIGILFAALGNLMPKVKSNFFLGIKTPWTLSDPDVWNRTQRLGGILFFALGGVMVLCGLVLSEHASFVILMVGILAVAFVPMVLSYIWCQQKVDKDGDR